MKCPSCGKDNFGFAKKCDHCGQVLTSGASPQQPATNVATGTSSRRAALVDEIRLVLDWSKAVVAGHNVPEFQNLANRLLDLTTRAAAYATDHPNDHPVAFLCCFVTNLGIEVEGFRRPARRDPVLEGKLTIATLARMAEHPGCVQEAIGLVVDPTSPLRSVQLTSSDVLTVMAVYTKLWNGFVKDRDIKCPLDAHAQGSVREYLTKRGKWDSSPGGS